MSGFTGNSGCGTPESFSIACTNINICTSDAAHHFCGLHDVQSKFWLAMMHCIGEGGLENKNALQLLHTLYSSFDEHHVLWRELL